MPFMYLDVKGLVTTAIGNLIDTPDDALSLPWVTETGKPATKDQIKAEWSYVKSRQDLKMRGGMAYKKITALRLTDAGIQEVVSRTLDRMDNHLSGRFPQYPNWPADAQLATLSMAWACGPAFRFPLLEKALKASDFALAAAHCKMSEVGNPGVAPRNVKNRELYLSAAGLLPAKRPEVDTVAGQQSALAKLGYNPGPADGVAGPKTKAAILSFQKDHGLTSDGVVGPKTRAALLSASAGSV